MAHNIWWCKGIFYRVYMDENNYGWKNKMDKRIKWIKMNQKNEGNMFTTRSYVSIQILPIHNWEVCVNPNSTYSQLRGMCQSKHQMFISKRYVLIKTPFFHLQELCVNRITTFSSPRSMRPLGIETIWGHTLSIPFQPVFYLNSIFQNSYV
jgi:hypothetical protein